MKKLILVICFFAISSVQASDLVFSKSADGGLDLDFLGGAENVTALQFAIQFDQKVIVDTANCLSGLPKTHQGACAYKNGVLKAAIFSPTNAVLSSGSIGQIGLNVSNAKYKVVDLLMGSPDGKEVKSNALGEGLDEFFAKEDREK